MYNLTSINAVQFQNLLDAIGQSGGGTDISEQLEAINTTLQNLQIQFSALASNVSLNPIEGLSASNVQDGISELNSSLSVFNDVKNLKIKSVFMPVSFENGFYDWEHNGNINNMFLFNAIQGTDNESSVVNPVAFFFCRPLSSNKIRIFAMRPNDTKYTASTWVYFTIIGK